MTAVLALVLISMSAATGGRPFANAQKQPESLKAAEFSRLVRELSEEGGYFRSDNFTSNETSYLHVIDKMREVGATGGAYMGVGPEQNFTYIAKVRPRIAFIIDIRRQAIIQHLMYKAVFHLSPNRTQFLSLLLSKPLPKEKAPSADAPINEILSFLSQISADDQTYTANLAAIRKAIQEDFQFPLSERDGQSLEYVYKSFRNEGLDISYRVDGYWSTRGRGFPTLKEIIAETDLNGKQGNFLASTEDYDFVRGLHRKNLIIPVVGDFGGKKAIAAVGDYLKKNGFTVTAFYTSNVEQYLFESGLFDDFAENVRKLPVNDKSLFIRAAAGRYPHPARLPGHRLTTLLQKMSVFLKDFGEGRYESYYDLVTTNFISAEKN
ncbi:MAG: hypothetical protein L0229_29120 [Blastocatellia bacterium]|nr:hypothetical protein [Blastocatellia bacterium]